MVDMVKKVHKKGAEFLQPGERVLGAATVTPVGQFKKTVAFGAVGGLIGAAVGNAIQGRAPEPGVGTQADGWPDVKQAILAVSDRRWILFEQSLVSGSPKGVAAEWAHGDIRGLEIEPGKLTSKINVIFSDGSAAQVEAVRAAKPQELVDAATAVG